jgi:hypothetical protein
LTKLVRLFPIVDERRMLAESSNAFEAAVLERLDDFDELAMHAMDGILSRRKYRRSEEDKSGAANGLLHVLKLLAR